MSYNYLNLVELRKISKALDKKRRIHEFSIDTLLCNYNGNTLVSMFCTEKRVLDSILARFENLELEPTEDA